VIITRTPYRISFFGGGTDYPLWYRKYGGGVLATTINKYCYLTVRYLPPFFEHRFRIVYRNIENCQSLKDIQHPSVRAVLEFFKSDRGLEIHHDGDLPARSGVGSSSAFTVGLVHALHALSGKFVSKHQLAMESINIEQNIIKETVGSQDQVSAAYGGLNHIVFHRNDEISVQPLTLCHDRIEELNSHLMFFYTGIKRTAEDVAKSYVNGIEKRAGHLFRGVGFVYEGIKILTGNEDIRDFGKLMHTAWQIKRELSPLVSNDHVDEIYDEALKAGAIGGKLLGAGGGGFMLLFAPPRKHKAIRERLKGLIYVPVKFELSGSHIIFFDPQENFADLDRSRSKQNLLPFRELTHVQ